MGISIRGTGRIVPANRRNNAKVGDGLASGDLAGAIKTGGRYHCTDENQIDLAVGACQKALKHAGMESAEVDLIISGSSVPYQPIPAMAPLVMRELGLADGKAAAFDVNSTCLSFLTALETAALMIDAGRARSALVFSSEIASRALPWDTAPDVAALFGDGAAAAVVGPGSSRLKAVLFKTFPSAYEACGIGAGGTRFDFRKEPDAFADHAQFAMDGKTLFRVAARHFGEFVDDLLAQAGWRKADVDLLVPHQASPDGLDHMVRLTGFDPARVVRIIEGYGNQIAASIPFAFDMAREQGRVTAGSKVLFLGTSAGVSFGGMALEV